MTGVQTCALPICEKGNAQTGVKDALDVNNGWIGAMPLRESGGGTGRDIPKRGAGDDFEELVVHSLDIRFELALNVDNENRCDQGE